MIGSALKKLANENGMKVDQGIAYGSLRGFAATLSEGSGYKQIVFSTMFADLANRAKLADLLNSRNLKKEYRVLNLNIDAKRIHIVFHDTIGTMKKIYAFLDWFIPLLQEYGASGVHTCTECGMETVSGKWVMVNGIAYYMHDACAVRVKNAIDTENTRQKEEDTGSYVLGTVGAFAGAAVGAIVWALVLLWGYVASVVGLLIGWLAERGYTLLRGKKGKAKILILILAIIFGVLAGTVAAEAMTLAGAINNGELPGLTLGDIPEILWNLTGEAEYMSAVGSNILMGLLFAALGVFALLKNASREVAGVKFTELK